MAKTPRGFTIDDADYETLTEYAYANRMTRSRALRVLIREHASGNRRPSLLLDDDTKAIIEKIAAKVESPGRPNEDRFDEIGNVLIRRGATR